jgi:hypothetical protein
MCVARTLRFYIDTRHICEIEYQRIVLQFILEAYHDSLRIAVAVEFGHDWAGKWWKISHCCKWAEVGHWSVGR